VEKLKKFFGEEVSDGSNDEAFTPAAPGKRREQTRAKSIAALPRSIYHAATALEADL